MIHAQASRTDDGEILHDASLGGVDSRWFDAGYWASLSAADLQVGGRGGIAFVTTPVGAAALRHYRRGGLVGRFNADRYLWTGAQRSRGFVEFRLLAQLHDAGLPVPAPLAARYVRHGLRYSADLLTQRIADAQTLAQRLAAGSIDATLATAIGTTLAQFHARGAFHADLNAHNVMIDSSSKIWLLDFDRGRLRKPALGWQQANIARLRRSLDKLGALKIRAFDNDVWHPLLAAYHRTLGVLP